MQKSIFALHISSKFTQIYCLEYPGRQNFYVAPYKQFLKSTMQKTKNKNSSFCNCQIQLYNSTFVELLHILWITLYVIKLMDTILYLIIMLDRIEKISIRWLQIVIICGFRSSVENFTICTCTSEYCPRVHIWTTKKQTFEKHTKL